MSERALALTIDDWLAELFAPEHRQPVLDQIASVGHGPAPSTTRAEVDLRDAERKLSRLVDAVEAGTFDANEVAERLKRLRQQRESARA